MVTKRYSIFGPVPSGWQLVKLLEVAHKIGSGATPRGGSSVYLNTRINYGLIRSQNVFDRYFDTTGLAYITDEQAAQLRGANVQHGDVLLNITGDGITFGRACLAPDYILPACVNQHVSILRVNNSACLPGFLVSYLTHSLTKEYIESFNSGGSRRAITKGNIKAFEIPLPPLPEQRAIAHILGTLDDKIELNRRINQTLEDIARALFKSWFVDFDPVKAKAEGRQPVGMDVKTAALFPDSFQESELGLIPTGWESKTVGAITEVLETGSRPRGGVSNVIDGVPSIGAEHIVGLGIFDFAKTKYVPLEYHQQMRRGHIRDRDILIYKDGGKPGLLEPHVAMFGNGFPFQTMCINEHVFRFRAASPLSQNFAYFWLSTPLLFDQMRMRATGVAQPGLNQEAIKAMPIIVPTGVIVAEFDAIVSPFVTLLLSNASESTTLATLRDTLLPKLISGELRVPDVEKLLEHSLL